MGYIKLSRIEELVWKVDTADNQMLYDLKYLTCSHIDSKKETELVIDRIDFNYHKNFIIFGIRNLSLISEIYNRMTPFSTIIIVEITDKDEDCIYLEGEENQLYFVKDPRVNIILGCENQLGRQLDIAFSDMLKLYNLRNLEVISMPYVKSTYPKELSNVIDVVFQKLHTSVFAFGNDVEDILIGMDNYVNNWSHVFNGLDCKYFGDAYKKKPAIIVGAGPSLDKNVDLLKEVKGKALILSVDGAMNTLRNKDIVPDVVSSIERVELTANFYKEKEIPEDIIYVGPNVVLKSILDRFNRIIFTGRTGDALFRTLNESIGFTNLNVGINVSHVLISFARYLGCSPIIFIGLDLAYTNGKTHTEKFSDNFDQRFMDNYKRNIVYVRGQNGEKLESFEHFMHTKSWIESAIARDKEAIYINATEGGANIEGADNLKFSSVISKYCGDAIPELKTLYDNCKKENSFDKKDITNKALSYFNDLNKYFEDLGKEAQAFYDKLLGSRKSGRVDLMEMQRAKMDEFFNKNLAGRFIVQAIFISYNRDIHSLPMVLDKQNEKKMYDLSLKYYKTLKAVSSKIMESIAAYIKILEAHINEDSNILEV